MTKGGQSNQKWDDMLKCLLEYIIQQKEKLTPNLPDEDKKDWKWDGNVPTTFKTQCGKALGRWINNQRSAKNKGTLKEDRESRLVSTGLKWSVLSTNAWPDMMEELRIYVKAKTQDLSEWDGNVPTNYRIKGNTAPDGSEIDEDKNLGRWINRQRSLYQAGKLKHERQNELEKIGLKWSVLSTTSWHAMYGALCRYADEKKREASLSSATSYWDGNVPANYRTEDNPPKSLGRWVNRQRSAFAKGKLKAEFVDKLERVGLKWAVHEKKPAVCNNNNNNNNNSSISNNVPNGIRHDNTRPKGLNIKKDNSIIHIHNNNMNIINGTSNVIKTATIAQPPLLRNHIHHATTNNIHHTKAVTFVTTSTNFKTLPIPLQNSTIIPFPQHSYTSMNKQQPLSNNNANIPEENKTTTPTPQVVTSNVVNTTQQ